MTSVVSSPHIVDLQMEIYCDPENEMVLTSSLEHEAKTLECVPMDIELNSEIYFTKIVTMLEKMVSQLKVLMWTHMEMFFTGIFPSQSK